MIEWLAGIIEWMRQAENGIVLVVLVIVGLFVVILIGMRAWEAYKEDMVPKEVKGLKHLRKNDRGIRRDGR